MITNDNASKFIARLKQVKNLAAEHKYPLDTIPGFLSTLEQTHILNVHDLILNDANLLERIEKMAHNEQIYIKRENKNPNMRSFCITRDASGEFALIIEPKSKRYDNTKRQMELERGSYKQRKIAIRTDLELPITYASLISYESDPSKIKQLDTEIKEQQVFDNKAGFAKIIQGETSIKQISKKGKQITVSRRVIYSPYQEYNLIQFLKRHPNLSIEQKSDIILQALDIVQQLHKLGKEHKDIKLENFLIDYDPKQGRYVLNLSDFGLIRDIGSDLSAAGTCTYLPTWIIRGICLNIYPQFSVPEILDRHNAKFFTDAQDYTQTFAAELMRRHIKNSALDSIGSDTCDGKHDVWSLGIMFYEILYSLDASFKRQMREVYSDPFLKHLFHLTARETPDINQVLELFNHTEYSIHAENFRAKRHDKLGPDSTVVSRIDSINTLLNQRSFNPDLFYDDTVNPYMIEHQQQIRTIFNSKLSSLYTLKALAKEIAENFDAHKNSDSVNVKLYYATMLYLVNKKIDMLQVLKENGFFRRWIGRLYKKRTDSLEQSTRLSTLRTTRELIYKLEDDSIYINRFKRR